MAIVDVHCHLLPKKESELLKNMDLNEIEISWICPDRKYIAMYNEQGNEYISKAVQAYPDRFLGFAVASPWLESREIKNILTFAKNNGLSGLKINTKIQGVTLLDESILYMVSIVQEFDWPVYCHTGTPVTAMPLQLAELADKFPSVNFIMGHGGFSDFWYDVPDVMSRCPNVYLETSFIPPSQIQNNININGGDRVVFGSDWPYSDINFELTKNKMLKIDQNTRLKILEKNSTRLMTKKQESLV